MRHVELTEGERASVLVYWRDFILSGGEGEPPSAFMLDALNDETVRDTFLFWHIGGDPFSQEQSAWADNPLIKGAMATLGPAPTNYNNTIKAMTKAVGEVNATDPDMDQVDTATVLVLAHVMMGMLLKEFDQSKRLLTDILRLNANMLRKGVVEQCIHQGPLEAIAIAMSIISEEHRLGDAAKVDQMLTDVFAVKRLPVLTNTKE